MSKLEPMPSELLREMNGDVARAVVTGLMGYSDALTWLGRYIDGEGRAKEQLDLYGRNFGLDLLLAVRLADGLRTQWRDVPLELDLRPVLPLASALGESYALMHLVDGPELAQRLPVISMERTQELFSSSVQSWLANHVSEVPQFDPAEMRPGS